MSGTDERAGGADRAARAGAADHAQPARGDERHQRRAVARAGGGGRASSTATPGLTAGVLTGAGRGFCAGMDLKAFSRGEDIGPMMKFIRNGAQKPLIGAIEGFALAGGLELALTCDLLVAAKGVKLGIPEVGRRAVRGGGWAGCGCRAGSASARRWRWRSPPTRSPPRRRSSYGLVARLTEPGEAVDVAMRTRRAGGPQRPAGGGGLEAAGAAQPGRHRGRVLGAAEAALRPGVHVERRQGRPEGVRREAPAGVDRNLTGNRSRLTCGSAGSSNDAGDPGT